MNLVDLARSALPIAPTAPIPAVQANGPARRWQVHFPNLDPVEMLFTPPATLAEALDACPGAIAAEPLPESLRRAATPAEAAELRELIPRAFPGISDHDVAGVFAVACADPEAALASFRALVADDRTRIKGATNEGA